MGIKKLAEWLLSVVLAGTVVVESLHYGFALLNHASDLAVVTGSVLLVLNFVFAVWFIKHLTKGHQ